MNAHKWKLYDVVQFWTSKAQISKLPPNKNQIRLRFILQK